jgi:hypothetical protein
MKKEREKREKREKKKLIDLRRDRYYNVRIEFDSTFPRGYSQPAIS